MPDSVGGANTGSKRKHTIRIILIVAVVLAAVVIGVILLAGSRGYRSVKVKNIRGDVELERNSREEDLREGMKLMAEDKVTTGESSLAELLIDSDKHLVAEENTCFGVNAAGKADSGKVTIRVEYGSTLATIDEKLAEGSEFEITTPNCTCSVRGTTFRVSYDMGMGQSRIDVSAGIVRVTAGTEELDLNAGESAIVDDTGIERLMTFGSYEQDGDMSNGPEPIEWEILDEGEEGILLISHYVLDCHEYNDKRGKNGNVTWENSTLRQWLNDDFLNSAFSPEEQARIYNVTLINPDNEYSGASGGNPTMDRVFCLSVEEVTQYYDTEETTDPVNGATVWSSERLLADATEYAISRGVIRAENSAWIYKDKAAWWLRSNSSDMSSCATMSGTVTWAGGDPITEARIGVRPVIRLFPESVNEKEGITKTSFDDEDASWVDETWDENREWTDRRDTRPHEVDGYIVFGAYEQDGVISNGPEPIEWEVLGTDEKGMLLVSRYVLDAQLFHEEPIEVTWDECTLRQWCNNDFYLV